MIKLTICLLALTLACADYPPRLSSITVCDSQTAERRAEFIVQCSTAANPHSDEEGEDLVSQCEETATNLFCRQERSLYYPDTYSTVACSLVKDPVGMKVCAQ